jgi:hypothetical protein
MSHEQVGHPKTNANREDRFVDQNVAQLLKVNETPIEGYLDYPLCTLEKSAEYIVPSIPSLSTIVRPAKGSCHKTSNFSLYTMSTRFYE